MSENNVAGGAVNLYDVGKVIFENSTFDSNYIQINVIISW